MAATSASESPAADPKSLIYPAAAGTLARNAVNNRVMPFHPGAGFYEEAGIKLPSP
jgi:TRAP-type uncharacterized transport system substrate-binding protein